MKPFRNFLLTTSILLALTEPLYAQAERQARKPLATRINEVMEQIKDKRRKLALPPISSSILDADATILPKYLPDLTPRVDWITLQREHVENIVLRCWFDLRIDPKGLSPNEPLSFPVLNVRFMSFSKAMGCIDVQSRPTGATIEVDDNLHLNPTNDLLFEEDGKHRLRLTMPGYEVIDEEISVAQRKTTSFKRTLKRK